MVYRLAAQSHPAANGRLAAIVIIWLATSLVWLWSNAANPVQVMYNVRVIRRMDDFNFKMAVENPNTHKMGEFAATFCSDFKPTPEIVAGTTLTELDYVEDRQNYCYEIRPKGLGYNLLRGDHNEPIVADAR